MHTRTQEIMQKVSTQDEARPSQQRSREQSRTDGSVNREKSISGQLNRSNEGTFCCFDSLSFDSTLDKSQSFLLHTILFTDRWSPRAQPHSPVCSHSVDHSCVPLVSLLLSVRWGVSAHSVQLLHSHSRCRSVASVCLSLSLHLLLSSSPPLHQRSHRCLPLRVRTRPSRSPQLWR